MLHNDSSIILPQTYSLLKKICLDSFFDNFFLVGGTSLALQIGHRFSIDLDFFSKETFETDLMINHLVKNYDFKLNSIYKNTVLGVIENVKVDFITHAYPLVDNLLIEEGIRMTKLLDIAAMKLNAIVNSGQRLKDFIDIFFLLEYHSLKELLSAYQIKYSYSNPIIALKAVSYFDDIDPNVDPPVMKEKLTIETIKKRILNAIEYPDNPDSKFNSILE